MSSFARVLGSPSREGHGLGIVNDPPYDHSLGNTGSREVYMAPYGSITRWDNRKHPHSRGYVGTNTQVSLRWVNTDLWCLKPIDQVFSF